MPGKEEDKKDIGPVEYLPSDRKEFHIFSAGGTKFEVPKRYTFVKPIGTGAYGVVISVRDSEKDTKVAIKKIPHAFDDLVDAKRILREIKLLRHFDHENIINCCDLIPPPRYGKKLLPPTTLPSATRPS
jgi:serine/threonine protein kinase